MPDHDSNYSLSEADKAELNKLVSVLELSSGTTIIFAITPESSPQHPVVKQLKESLAVSEEQFEFTNFFYSQNSFHNFLYSLDDQQHQSLETGRKLVMAFGIDQLPTPRLVKEMRQLNLGREELFGRNLCLILWLNNIDFLDEFRQRAPDFWDWRGKVVKFEIGNFYIPSHNSTYSLSETDKAELNKLVSVLELSSGTTIIFAIAPENSPQHPVVKQLVESLATSNEKFEFTKFFYSQNSFYNFLYSLDDNQQKNLATGRKLVMAFGIDQLPTPRLVREMNQLNLGKEEIISRNLVLILWLNKANFIDEFRRRAPDFWDLREKIVEFETRNPLLYPYLDWLIAENSYFKMSGVTQVNRQVDIFLDQSYVSLQTQWRQQVTDTSERSQRELEGLTVRQAQSSRLKEMGSNLDDWDEPYYYEMLPEVPISALVSSTKTVTEKVDLYEAVRQNWYSVILGSPGAGKTTLLRYLALHFAIAKRDELETVIVEDDTVEDTKNKELGKTLLPIFFRIADYAEKLKQQPELTLLEYLCQFYPQWEAHFQAEVEIVNEVAALLLNAMRQGQCLMLLDGLDEVFDLESRKHIVESINKFVDEFPSNKFVITSRIASYSDLKLSSRFAEFTIEDMDSEQVERFLYRWCRTVEKAQQPDVSEEQWLKKGTEQAQEILQAVKDNPGVQRLTANPLLLTILALIHRNGERLPNRRVKLYELAVQTLTEDWQLGKKLPDAPRVVLKETEVVELLAPLAYWMHEEKPSGLVTQAEVEEKLAAKLAELNDAEPESDSVRQAVGEFLRKVRETTGLFVERMPGFYGFMHLTFEEYFAARYIADKEQSEILELIQKHLNEPRWNEPLLLALGYYGSHFSRQFKKLAEKLLFSNIEDYQPVLQNGEIKIKSSVSDDATIVYFKKDESANKLKQSEFQLRNLLFAGQVIAEIEINNIVIRKKPIQDLVITYLGIDVGFEDDITKQILRLLRKIEFFCQKGEVLDLLKQAANNSNLSEEIRVKAKAAILYIACGESKGLADCVTEVVNQLEPLLFCSIRELFKELGDDMTPTLEHTRQHYHLDEDCQTALNFITAMSYMRKNKYDKAIEMLELLTDNSYSRFSAYIAWSLATCYQEKESFEQAISYYQECFEKLAQYIEPSAFLMFWRNRGICHRLHGKYEQALDCFQRMLTISREINKPQDESLALYHIGRNYQEWGKYEQAINYHQQSRQLYEQLGKDNNVANQWYWLGECYREWGKYKQAVECENQDLAIRQQLDDQVNVALAYWRLGRIYQNWLKYDLAVIYYQESRELYQQLEKDNNVADLWYWLGECYREWGKYEQAIECENQDLAIRQQLDDQVNVALAYCLLGRIYQNWGKYELAINYYQQSRELYQQLGKDKNVAGLWYWLGDCYREWGKYEQAIECKNQELAIHQQLDDQVNIALAYRQLGRIYQNWLKYDLAVIYYQESRELYQQLEKNNNVADLWYWLGDCYREWGKYEQAIECENQDLAIRQQLDDQVNVALAYCRLGRIYQNGEKYELAINYYQQSRELYQQLGKDKNVAGLWYWLGDCYREWGRYELAIECENQDLAICQQLDDKINIANAYRQLGRIYQTWGRYELAIEYENQDLAIRQQLDEQVNVALAYWRLGRIYQEWGRYEQAIDYYQQSLNLHQQLDQKESVARRYRQLAYCQCLLAKQVSNSTEISNLLTQAEENIRQAIEINTASEYQGNLAYDYTALGLLYSQYLRLLPNEDTLIPEKIALFEEYYHRGLSYLDELGQIVDKADESLDMARAYLEIEALENLNLSEEIAQECLQIFQEYNRRQLEASAHKLLGEIYLKRSPKNQPDAEIIATQFLTNSLQIYRDLDLQEKAVEIEELIRNQTY